MRVQRLAEWRVLVISFEMALRSNLTDGFVLFGIFVQPILLALLAFWMLQDQVKEEIVYIVVGSGLTSLWTVVLFISGQSINGERHTGTLESLVAVPASLRTIIMGKNLANVTQSLVSMIACYALAGLIFGALPQIAQPIWFAVSLLLGIVSFAATGLILAALFVLNADFSRFQNGLEFPIYILAGFLFPVALLPDWTTPLSYILAPYWAARALQNASSDNALIEILFPCLMMVLLTIIYALISRELFRRILFKARVEATLGRH
jgi:ABC-2 type transport system permease protein